MSEYCRRKSERMEIFAEEQYSMYDAPPLDAETVARAERTLGVRLPRAYLDALRERNGGVLARQSFPVRFPNPSGNGHIGVQALLGLGGRWGVDVMSKYLVEEWEYPEIGVVVCMLPSGGHDTVMLDYSRCGPQGEPTVVYVGEDRVPRAIAGDFEEFLDGLTDGMEAVAEVAADVAAAADAIVAGNARMAARDDDTSTANARAAALDSVADTPTVVADRANGTAGLPGRPG